MPGFDPSDGLRILRSDPLSPGSERQTDPRPAAWLETLAGAQWDEVDPGSADLIVVPWLPNAANRDPAAVAPALAALLERLPHYEAHADKHVILDNSDLDLLDWLPSGHLFKSSVSTRLESVHALPYAVPDPGPSPPVESAPLDFCFQGALGTHPVREAMNLWRYGWDGWRGHFQAVEPFWTLPPERRTEFRLTQGRAIRESRFVLCPRGRGLNSRRFFEALSHGRVPILYADAAKLPLESSIPWDELVVRVPEGFGSFTPYFVDRFLERQDLATAARLARDVWLRYLAPDRLRTLVVGTLRDAGALS